MVVGSRALPGAARAAAPPDVTLEIAPYILEASPKHRIQTAAYNGQIPGPLFLTREEEPRSVEIRNLTKDSEVVHWHGLYLPSEMDGAMEEGTPMIAPGASTRYTINPKPAGFRRYHTHTFAGKDLTRPHSGGRPPPGWSVPPPPCWSAWAFFRSARACTSSAPDAKRISRPKSRRQYLLLLGRIGPSQLRAL
jgi:hypothetical protein